MSSKTLGVQKNDNNIVLIESYESSFNMQCNANDYYRQTHGINNVNERS